MACVRLDLLKRTKQTVPRRTPSLEEIPMEFHDVVFQRATRLKMEVSEYLRYLGLPAKEKMPITKWIKTLDSKGPVLGKGFDVVAILQEAREERDEQLFNVINRTQKSLEDN